MSEAVISPRVHSSRKAVNMSFNPDELLSAFGDCNRFLGDVPMSAFMDGMEQLRRIVLTLGSAFGIASSDITEKLETLAKRVADLEAAGRPIEPPKPGAASVPYSPAAARVTVQCASGGAATSTRTAQPAPSSSARSHAFPLLSRRSPDATRTSKQHVPSPLSSVFSRSLLFLPARACACADMVDWELERKVEAQTTKAYTSASRSILRLLWFMDFLQVLLGLLTRPAGAPHMELKAMASEAYDKALAPHHPWLVRKTIGAAMIFCPTEASFWKRIVAETNPPRDEAYVKAHLASFLIEMAPVRDVLWAFFHARKLENLP